MNRYHDQYQKKQQPSRQETTTVSLHVLFPGWQLAPRDDDATPKITKLPEPINSRCLQLQLNPCVSRDSGVVETLFNGLHDDFTQDHLGPFCRD
jgi:hypothetical protein